MLLLKQAKLWLRVLHLLKIGENEKMICNQNKIEPVELYLVLIMKMTENCINAYKSVFFYCNF